MQALAQVIKYSLKAIRQLAGLLVLSSLMLLTAGHVRFPNHNLLSKHLTVTIKRVL